MRMPILALASLALLAGCHNGAQTENQLANTADHLADEADKWGDNASNRIDNAGDRTQNRIDALDNRMEGIVDPPAAEKWIGTWKGVDGRRLEIARSTGKAPGHYLITDNYAPHKTGTFDGVAKDSTIVLARPDGQQTLRATDGKGTGVEALAKKTDCLVIKSGEGYCRS